MYEIPDGMEEICKNQPYNSDKNVDTYAQHVKMNMEANGYRLPIEEEWEYTARGGEDYTCAGSNNLNEVGWYKYNSGETTHGVGKKKSNGPYGLYDMGGNVAEWCFDEGHDDSYVHRGLRGGSWDHSPLLRKGF